MPTGGGALRAEGGSMTAPGVRERIVSGAGVDYVLAVPAAPAARAGRGDGGAADGRADADHGNADHGGVVFVHGLGCHRDECLGFVATLAARLARRGIPSVRFDLPGHATRAGGTEQFTLKQCVREVGTAVDVLATSGPPTTGTPPVLFGASFGGAVSIAAAADLGERIGGLVLLGAVGDFDVLTGSAAARERGLATALAEGRDVDWDWGVTISAALNRELHEVDLGALFARVPVPAVVVHGEYDDVVPHSVAAALVEVHPAARLVTLPDTGHVVAAVGDAEGTGEQSRANLDLLLGLLSRPPARRETP